jgi:hypothetical protein
MTKLIQAAATISAPAIRHRAPESHNIPLHIEELVCEIAELDADGSTVENL